jgi:hypothetical protein
MDDRATEYTDKTLSKVKQNNHSQSFLENGQHFRNQPEILSCGKTVNRTQNTARSTHIHVRTLDTWIEICNWAQNVPIPTSCVIRYNADNTSGK